MTDIIEQMKRHPDYGKETLKKQRAMEQNFYYTFEHLDEWRLQHPEKWTAVYDSKLVAVESNVEDLRRALSDKNIPIRDTYLTYVHREKYDLVL